MALVTSFKGSANIEAANLIDYAELCGWALARAHVRSGDAAVSGGNLGKSDAVRLKGWLILPLLMPTRPNANASVKKVSLESTLNR